MNPKLKNSLFLLLLTLLKTLNPLPTLAQEFSLKVSPPLVEILAQPGTAITQAYQIKNNSQKDILLTTILKPFTASQKPGLPSYDVQTNPNLPPPVFSLGNSDLKIGDSFTIPAQSQQQIVLKIRTPPKNLLSDYYYTLFFAQVSNPQSSSLSSGQVGTNLLISVSPDSNPPRAPQTLSFTVHPKFADLFFSKVKFQALIKNQGKTLLKPFGQIRIQRSWPPTSQDYSPLLIRPDNILADSSRPLSCLYENDETRTTCQVDSYLPPGQYQATLSYCTNPDPNQKNRNCQETTLYFYVFPYLALLLLFLPFLYYLFQKNKKA